MRLRAWGYLDSSRKVALYLALALAGAVMPGAASAQASDEPGPSFSEWWSENFEVHGFLTTKTYWRTPDFENKFDLSSWRSEINLEFELRVFENDDWRVGLYSVVRPIFDAVYDVHPDLWGADLDRAAIGTGAPAPFNGNSIRSGKGKDFPGGGGRLSGEFTIINNDTGSFFSGERTPAVAIDDVVFFGRVASPVMPRSEGGGLQDYVGGKATGETYEDLRDNFPVPNAGLLPNQGLNASLTTAATMPLRTPLNWYAGGKGDKSSFKQGSVDVNRTENQLKWDCRDNAHPYCALREVYAEVEYRNTFLRVGRQQIVWGKTDAFRLQDKINPIDLGYHNVFPDLEERRIPLWSLDMIHSFGDVGWFEDVSLEFAWVFDRFIPDQFGQCGEPYAFTAACQVRVDSGAHQLFNIALAEVNTVDWNLENTEPGLRLEFRIPEPSIAFSLSAFYTHQDTPVARFSNHYSMANPNPAVMLFLQGLADPTLVSGFNPTGSVARQIDILNGNALAPTGAGACPDATRPWFCGFDPYAKAASGAPLGSLLTANNQLRTAWMVAYGPAGANCGVLGTDRAIGACVQNSGIQIFGFPWSTSEAILKYPRIWALGASMDYQIPGIDTVLRVELAADINRHITNTAKLSMQDKSPVFQAAIGLDRATFIPFLNRNRTAFISFQTFVEHIVDYDDGSRRSEGMVPYETSVISTAFMQNYWRNDSIILTSFAAYDWMAKALILGPSLRYVFTDHWFFDLGVNLLFGQKRKHNLRDVCADGTLGCLADPNNWQAGNWQMLNANLMRAAEHPWWSQESFADKFMRKRDEVWFGVTYQF